MKWHTWILRLAPPPTRPPNEDDEEEEENIICWPIGAKNGLAWPPKNGSFMKNAPIGIACGNGRGCIGANIGGCPMCMPGKNT